MQLTCQLSLVTNKFNLCLKENEINYELIISYVSIEAVNLFAYLYT